LSPVQGRLQIFFGEGYSLTDFCCMFNPKSKTAMKNKTEIAAHTFLWSVFILLTLVFCKLYLQAVPGAPFARNLNYVVFLELAIGLIFFYTTFLGIPWALREKSNLLILSAILLLLLLVFAWPAAHFGVWQILSSLLPHLLLIFVAILFHRSFRRV